jgi:hypothetical protein
MIECIIMHPMNACIKCILMLLNPKVAIKVH